MRIDPADIEVHTMRPSGGTYPGDGAVLVVHRPTGIAVRVSGERTQLGDQRLALARLELLVGGAADWIAAGWTAS